MQMAELAHKSKLGARSLRQIVQSAFKEALLSAPNGEYANHVITINQTQTKEIH